MFKLSLSSFAVVSTLFICSSALASTVYVESNIATPGQNSILAYSVAANGMFTPLPGSPFLTGGAGVVDPTFALGPFDSDQEVMVNPEHTFLFAVNSGSNTIAVFKINADDSLTPVVGSPFPSFGINPVSVGYDNGILIVVNKHQDPAQASDQTLPNYTSFLVAPNGALTHISGPGSTVEVPYGSSPSQAFVKNGIVFGADFLGGVLQSFSLVGGHLLQNFPTSLPNSEFKDISAPHLPLGIEASPNGSYLYVGFPTASKLGVYTYDGVGLLQFVRTVPNSGKAICWLRSNAAGTYLYSSNSGDHSVSVYDTSKPDQPLEIQRLSVTATGGLFQLALDPSGARLYVIEQRSAATIPQGSGNAIHFLQIDPTGGKIYEPATNELVLKLPGDTRPQGIVAL